jgi:hypothetical protein
VAAKITTDTPTPYLGLPAVGTNGCPIETDWITLQLRYGQLAEACASLS